MKLETKKTMDHWLKNAIENLFSHSIEINDFLLSKREWLYTGVDERDDCDTCYQALDQMGFTTTGLIDLIDAIRNGWVTMAEKSDAIKKHVVFSISLCIKSNDFTAT